MDDKLFSKILKLISTRERSEKEIWEYLKKSGVSETDSAFVIDRLLSSKLISDKRFAESKIRSRIYNKLWGKEKIRLELLEFGINSDIIVNELQEIEDTIWIQNCETLIERTNTNKKIQIEIFKLKKKLFQMGYSQSIIKKAFSNKNIHEEFEYDLE